MVILVMGVSGSGKTTIGKRLASSLNWQFSDADDFHSSTNIQKMRDGIPLNDADRLPWLQAIKRAIDEWLNNDINIVLACSSLKSSYRQCLYQKADQVKLIYLKGSFKLIYERLSQRPRHYMSADLLQSQFDTLEEPENALQVEIDQSPVAIVKQIRAALEL